ncbi:MAG: hypothetical protein ABR579_00060 [Actinomycetota bacterium]
MLSIVRAAVTSSPPALTSLLNMSHTAASIGKFEKRNKPKRQIARVVANEFVVNESMYVRLYVHSRAQRAS